MYRFSRQAMGTIIDLYFADIDQSYAASAAEEVFRLIERLEQLLSRFIPTSDISRINALPIGGSTVVSLETFECLKQCREIYYRSGGVFDVTIGALYRIWLNEDKSLRNPSARDIEEAKRRVGFQHLVLNEADFSVTMAGGPVVLDLGGFGKGYALDLAAELLQEWEIPCYMLNAGQSSLRFGDPPAGEPWRVTLSDPFNGYRPFRELRPYRIAISGSGLQKGRHIIDPRFARPVENRRAAWSYHPSAAYADGWSTAFMMLNLREIRAACRENSGLGATILFSGYEPLEERLFDFGEFWIEG
ncbi:MAG: FAD:protein FMN transferase [candidate division KSB1 bacterium]|nr:FAD:protein FMN transferase [candidate division KSB1 bacterium]